MDVTDKKEGRAKAMSIFMTKIGGKKPVWED